MAQGQSEHNVLISFLGRADQAQRELRGLINTIRQLPDRKDVRISVEADRAKGEVRAVERELRRLQDGEAGVEINIGPAMARLEQLEQKLLSVDRETVSPEVEMIITRGLAQIELYKSRLRSIDRRVHTEADFDAGNAIRDIAGVEGGLGRLARSFDDAQAGGSTFTGALHGFETFLRRLGPVVAGLAILIGVTLVSAIAAAAASFAAAIGGVVALANALVAALGPAVVLIVALFQRLAAVMQARQAVQTAFNQSMRKSAAATSDAADASREAAQAAERERAAAQATRDARQALTRAERDYHQAVRDARQAIRDSAREAREAARDQIEAQRDLTRAQQDWVRATREAANDIAEAYNRVQEATEAVADAQRNLDDSAKDITEANRVLAEETVNAYEAWEDAIRGVEEAQLALERSGLDLADAEDEVGDIQERINTLLKEMGATDPTEVLKKLEDIDLQAFTPEGLLIELGLAGEPEDIEKLTDLTRDLDRAKLGVREATLAQTTAEDALGDAQREQAGFVRDGILAYDGYRNALEGVANAERGRDQATRDLRDSQKELTQAASEWQEISAAGISQSDAVRSAAEAVRNAQNRLRDTTFALRDAEAEYERLKEQGIRNSPAVVSAAEQVRDAQESLADTYARIRNQATLAGLAIAKANAPESFAGLEDAKQKLLDLSNAELRLLGILQQIGPAFREALQPATDAIINAIGTAILNAGSALQALRPELIALGQEWAHQLDLFRQEIFDAKSLDQFAKFTEAARELAGSFGRIARNVFSIFSDLAEAALPQAVREMRRLADGTGKLAEKTEDIENMEKIVDGMVESFDLWLELVGSVAAAFGEFAAIVKPFGDDLVRWVNDAVNGFREWQRSEEGRKQIQAFFRDTLPFVKSFVTFLFKLGKVALQAFQFIAPALTLVFDTLSLVLDAVSFLYGLLNKIPASWRANLLMLIPFVGWLGKIPWIGRLIVSNFSKVVGIFSLVRNLFGDLGGIIANAVSGIGGALAGIGGDVVGVLADGIKSAGSVIADAATWFFNTWRDAVEAYVGKYVEIGGWIIGKVLSGLSAIGGAISSAATWLFNTYKSAVEAYAGALAGIGRAIIGHVVSGIRTVVEGLTGIGGWLKNRIADAVTAVVSAYVAIGRTVIGHIIDGLMTVGSLLASFGGWLKDRVFNAAKTAADAFREAGHWVLERVVQGLTTVGGLLADFGSWLGDRIWNAIRGLAGRLKEIGSAILSGIVEGIKDSPGKLKDALKGVIEDAVGFLGLGSPSKLFAGYGRDLMLGLVQGLGQVNLSRVAQDAFTPLTDMAEGLKLEPLEEIEDIELGGEVTFDASGAREAAEQLALALGEGLEKEAPTALQGGAKALSESLTTLIRALAGSFAEPGRAIAGFVDQGLAAVPSAFAQGAPHIAAMLKNALTAIASQFTGRGLDILNWINQGVLTAPATFAAAAQRISSLLRDALGAIFAQFENRGAEIVRWVGDGIEKVPESFDKAASHIRDMLDVQLTELNEQFGNIGERIVKQIAIGMRALAESWEKKPGHELVQFAKGMVAAIREALEFGSPSKPMLDVGRDLVASVTHGMNSENFVNFIRQWLGGLRGFMLDVGVNPIQEPFKWVMDALHLDVGARGDPKIARTIAEVAREFNATPKEVLAAFEAALAESGMRNLRNAVDKDSIGVFQQRPSMGWGSVGQILDPRYAARQFFRHLKGVSNDLPAHLMAQAVQKSAFSDGSNYAAQEGEAAKWAKRFGYTVKDMLGQFKRVVGDIGGGGREGAGASALVSFGRELVRRSFQVGEHPSFGGVVGRHVANSWHYKGRAIDINWPNAGAEMFHLDRLFEEIMERFKGRILELLWRVRNHFDHLHLAMAGGGIATRSVFAQIGERGKEAVIPLSRTVLHDLAVAIMSQVKDMQVALPNMSLPSVALPSSVAAPGAGNVFNNNFNIPQPAGSGTVDPRVTAALLAQQVELRGGFT
jgi:hypothetical protein